MRKKVGRTSVLWSFLITKSSILKNGGMVSPRDDTLWLKICNSKIKIIEKALSLSRYEGCNSLLLLVLSLKMSFDPRLNVRYQINQIYGEMKFRTIFIFDLRLSLINFTFDQTRIPAPHSSLWQCQSEQSNKISSKRKLEFDSCLSIT